MADSHLLANTFRYDYDKLSHLRIDPYKQISFSIKLRVFPYPQVQICVSGAQKNRLIETVLLSTSNTCFGWEIRNFVGITASLLGAWSMFCKVKRFITIIDIPNKTGYIDQ